MQSELEQGAKQGRKGRTYGQIAAALFVYEIDLRLSLHTKLCVAPAHKLHATRPGDWACGRGNTESNSMKL